MDSEGISDSDFLISCRSSFLAAFIAAMVDRMLRPGLGGVMDQELSVSRSFVLHRFVCLTVEDVC
jgi:hypothetical protein